MNTRAQKRRLRLLLASYTEDELSVDRRRTWPRTTPDERQHLREMARVVGTPVGSNVDVLVT